jgi:WD40 repeat protein
VVIWDAVTWREIARLAGHAQGVNQLAWSPVSDVAPAATCSYDSSILIWSMRSWDQIRELRGHTGDVRDVAWSPDGSRLASISERTVSVWDTTGGVMISSFSGRSVGEARRVLWLDQGGTLIVAWVGGRIFGLDPQQLAGGPTFELRWPKLKLVDIAVSADERMLAACSEEGAIQIWSWPDRVPVRELIPDKKTIRSVSFSHDRRYLAANTQGRRGEVIVYETTDWREVARFEEPTSSFWPPNVSWAPNSPTLVTLGQNDTTLRVWRVGEIQQQAPPGYRPDPPMPGPVRNETDTQKGRWGGHVSRDGRSIQITLWESHTTRSAFYFDARVLSVDGSALEGPVLFHLHHSYPKSVIWIRKIREGTCAILENVSATGVYTIGVQVRRADGEWTSLELDLATVKEIPKRFRAR